jgi:hypothetical protein
MDYKKKYLKYKFKYDNLRGGSEPTSPEPTSLFGSIFGLSTGQSTDSETLVDQPFEYIESDSIEPINEKNKFKYGSNDIQIDLICCGGEKTVFPVRVKGCEAATEHQILRLASKVVALESSYDAIVKIVNNSAKNPNLKIESTNMQVINKENHMSDHNAIVTNLVNPDTKFNFNLLSFNMEGLCDRNYFPDEFGKRLKLLEEHISESVTPGFIMPCQELVLQKDTSKLNDTGVIIFRELNRYLESKSGLTGINFISDGFTGGIFYDSSIWNLIDILEIPRDIKKPLEKKSNFYLFNYRKNKNLNIGIVNIHLKAPTPGAYFNLVEKQRLELQNILMKVNSLNPGFAVPVYLCGDYNNNSNKAEQIFNSSIKIDPTLSIFFDQTPIF